MGTHVRTESGEHAVQGPCSVGLGWWCRRGTACRPGIQRARQLGLFLQPAQRGPDLLDTPTVNGLPTLLMRYYPTTLLDRLISSAPFSDVLQLTVGWRAFYPKSAKCTAHTPPTSWWTRMAIHSSTIHDRSSLPNGEECHRQALRRPEEASQGHGLATWSLCAGLYQSAMVADALRDQPIEHLVPVPSRGLDKIASRRSASIVGRMKSEAPTLGSETGWVTSSPLQIDPSLCGLLCVPV